MLCHGGCFDVGRTELLVISMLDYGMVPPVRTCVLQQETLAQRHDVQIGNATYCGGCRKQRWLVDLRKTEEIRVARRKCSRSCTPGTPKLVTASRMNFQHGLDLILCAGSEQFGKLPLCFLARRSHIIAVPLPAFSENLHLPLVVRKTHL